MIGKILKDLPSCIEDDFFFRAGDVVSCGFHDDEGEHQPRGDYFWAETFGWNPSRSLDFLTADDIEIISPLNWQEHPKTQEHRSQ